MQNRKAIKKVLASITFRDLSAVYFHLIKIFFIQRRTNGSRFSGKRICKVSHSNLKIKVFLIIFFLSSIDCGNRRIKNLACHSMWWWTRKMLYILFTNWSVLWNKKLTHNNRNKNGMAREEQKAYKMIINLNYCWTLFILQWKRAWGGIFPSFTFSFSTFYLYHSMMMMMMIKRSFLHLLNNSWKFYIFHQKGLSNFISSLIKYIIIN